MGQQGKGETPRVCSAIVVVAMVAIVVVAREMAVACLTRPPRAVTSVIDARRCLALWECRREGERTTANEFRRNRDSPCSLPLLSLSLSLTLFPPHLSRSHSHPSPSLLFTHPLSLPFISHGCLSCASVH